MTILEDGRALFIAGEHEDSYDPDFCIYNDLIVFHTDKSVQIFAYPREVFLRQIFTLPRLWEIKSISLALSDT